MSRRIDARNGEIAVAAALAVVGLFFVWQASLLPFGSVALPGPGFFPLALGVLLALASLGTALRVLRSPGAEQGPFGHREVVLTFAALLCVPLLFERLGAVATLGLFIAVAVIVIGRTAWWRAATGAVIGVIAAWYFFKQLLGVQLPPGIFG